MDQAAFEELQGLAIKLFRGDSDANARLTPMLENYECVPQLQYLLDNSVDQYALFFASKTLEQLLTKFWTKFPLEYKIRLRSYILEYLLLKCDFLLKSLSELGPQITDSLCKTIGRFTKLGWFEDPSYKNIINDAKNFLSASSSTQYYVGLRIMNAVTDDMNVQTAGQTITTHRKIAVSYRDHSLLESFIIGVTCLRDINSGTLAWTPLERSLNNEAALKLTSQCLSFDFIGSNIEEGEDINTVQVPTAWRPYIQDSIVLNLLFEYYINTDPSRSRDALECIVHLSSVRRTLFENDNIRNEFLRNLMKGMIHIMNGKIGLQYEENHHELCRLIGRLRANFYLSDLVKIPESMDWLQATCKFTISTLEQLTDYMNGSQYLLAMWAKLVASIPLLQTSHHIDQQSVRCVSTLKECVTQVTEVYIKAAINCAMQVANEEIDDPLDANSEGTVREQLERFAGMVHIQYDQTADYIGRLVEECMVTYQNSAVQGEELVFVEGKLAWFTNIISAMISYSASSSDIKKGDEIAYDGKLCRYVFSMIDIVDARGATGHSSAPLQKAILNFFRMFKKSYMVEGVTSVTSMSASHTASSHPLLAAVLASNVTKVEEDRTIFSAMGLGDMNVIMNIIICKLCSNINFCTTGFDRSNEVLDETLEVFIELISSYSSSKMLLQLDAVQRIVNNHTGDCFPFLGYNNENKYRIKFYAALMRLVFTSSEDINNSFDTFIAPNVAILDQLSGMQSLKTPDVRLAIIGILRDLRGIAEATYNKRTYNLLFETLHPKYFDLFARIATDYALDNDVATALLKFLMEFVHNKASRITFELSSANGILLFRETSKIVCIISKQVMEAPLRNFNNIYVEKYKNIRLLLMILINALSGNYVNFGVFALYNDPCLQDAMTFAVQICLRIPQEHIMEYTKLSKAYFGFLEVLFRSHLDVVCQLDSSSFIKLLGSNLVGLESQEPTVAALCANTFDHLTSYIFLNRTKMEKPTMRKIAEHIGTQPEILNDYMASLFQVLLLNSSTASAYSLTRPILSLLLANDSSFFYVRDNLIAIQTSPENQEKLTIEFGKLLDGIQQSLETSNRDKFTQKLTAFKNTVREFLTF